MCTILDANVVHEVFGDRRTEAGKNFFQYVVSRRTKLVVGGKLLEEYRGNHEFFSWLTQAIRTGIAVAVDDDEVHLETNRLRSSGLCVSDDPHIIALARCTRSRLLYSNDLDLHKDFKNPSLLSEPKGKIYSTRGGGDFKRSHRKLLEATNLCRVA